MKKIYLLVLLVVLICTGCQVQKKVTSIPDSVEELETQTIPENQKQEVRENTTKSEKTQTNVFTYKGAWFDIEYPQNFIARPITPTTIYNDISIVQTDEAYFISPDKTVEFFIYSPQWSGEPENYTQISLTEELVSEKTEQTKGNERSEKIGDSIIHWVTIKAKDNSYYRSFVSIKDQVGSGSELHHVFGIKYKDSVAYEKYKDAYIAFKNSLNQYAD